MKREIKFKAWDSVNKVMELNVHHLDSLNEILHKEKYNIMQFTGLKDKNGCEIYEGDIVEIYNIKTRSTDDNYIGEVIMYKTKWILRNDKKDVDLIYYQNRIMVDGNENLTVIGNIYENPKLLQDAV